MAAVTMAVVVTMPAVSMAELLWLLCCCWLPGCCVLGVLLLGVGCWQQFRGCAHLALPAGRQAPIGVSNSFLWQKAASCTHTASRQGRCLHVACCSCSFLPAGLAPILGLLGWEQPSAMCCGMAGVGAIACAPSVDSCTRPSVFVPAVTGRWWKHCNKAVVVRQQHACYSHTRKPCWPANLAQKPCWPAPCAVSDWPPQADLVVLAAQPSPVL